jgi:ABC-2 type transport system ATP-binding protein
MVMNSVAIDCRQLSKRYGKGEAYALKNLSLKVMPGEVYGFLGPNGAGKSTTIRTLLNFIQPTSGQASILGLDIIKNSVAVKSKVGYLAGEVALYPRMTGEQFLGYMTDLQPLKNPAYLKELTSLFEAQLDKPIENLSKGNRQKLGVIQAFMHEPEVLILDEPTSGLDPLMQAAFYETVEAAKRRGAAVFLSSHDLAEVRKMCDRIGFIRQGELVAQKTIADLQDSAQHSFDITFTGTLPLKELRALHDSTIKQLPNDTINIQLKGSLTPLFKILASHSVIALDKHEVNLEDEFLSLYEKDDDDDKGTDE